MSKISVLNSKVFNIASVGSTVSLLWRAHKGWWYLLEQNTLFAHKIAKIEMGMSLFSEYSKPF